MKKLTFWVCGSLLSLAALSHADEDSTSSVSSYGSYASGFYGAAQLGFGNTSALNSGVNAAPGGRVDAGYKIDPYMGIEAGITGLTNPDAGSTLASMQFYDVSFVGMIPLGNRFDLHGQAGLAYGNMGTPSNNNGVLTGQASTSELVTMLGVGMDVYLTKSFALTANDYMYLGSTNLSGNNSIGNTNVVMGGVKFNF